MAIPIKLVSAFRKARLFAIDHEAGLEIGAGITCFAVSVVCAAKAAIKSKQVMEEYNKQACWIAASEHEGLYYKTNSEGQQDIVEYNPENAKKDMGKLKRRTVGKLVLTWTPCALGFAAGTGLVLRSHHVMVKSNLGLAAALKTTEVAFDDYRKRVANKIGDEAEDNLYNGIEKTEKVVKEKDKNGKTVTKKVFSEERSDFPVSRYGRIMGRDYVERDADWDNTSDDYNKRRVKVVEDHANRKLRRVGKITLNEVYDALGLSPTDDGDVVGWRLEELGGKTPMGGIEIKIYEHMLKADPNAVAYVHDDWTDSMVKMAEPFWLDFNVEGCILAKGTVNKLGGRS